MGLARAYGDSAVLSWPAVRRVGGATQRRSGVKPHVWGGPLVAVDAAALAALSAPL